MGTEVKYKVICDSCRNFFKFTQDDLNNGETIENFLGRADWIVEDGDVTFCCEDCQVAMEIDMCFIKDLPIGFSWKDLDNNKCVILDDENYVYFVEGNLSGWEVADLTILISDYPEEIIHLKKCWDKHLKAKGKNSEK